MTVLGWVVLVGALVVLTAGWFMWTATRLDRVHLKAETAEATLRTSLARRSAIAIELASTGLVDPASAVLLMQAAAAARDAAPDDWQAESDLSETLRALQLDRCAAEAGDCAFLGDELREAGRGAAIARGVHNDLAARALALHHRRRVRWFRLAGQRRAAGPDRVRRPLVRASGHILPASGRVVPASGHVVPASGRVVPASGRVVPASGRVVPASGRVVAGGSGRWSVWETKSAAMRERVGLVA